MTKHQCHVNVNLKPQFWMVSYGFHVGFIWVSYGFVICPFISRKERHLDANDPEVLARVHSLAVSLENLGEKTTAEEFYRRAYLGRCKRLGSEHRDVLDSGYNLATCCKNLGKSAEARDLFKTILEGCLGGFGQALHVFSYRFCSFIVFYFFHSLQMRFKNCVHRVWLL